MDYEKKYNEALERAKKLQENSNGMILKKWLWNIFPELKESEDERIRKELLSFCQNRADNYPNDPKYANIGKWIAWLEKQGESYTKRDVDDAYVEGMAFAKNELKKQGEAFDKIAQRARTEKQRVLVTESDGVANIDWDTRSLQDAKQLMEYGLNYIKKIEKQGEQKPADKVEPKFHEGDWVVSKLGNVWYIDSFDNKNYKVTDINGNYNCFPIYIQDRLHLWTIQDAKDGDVLATDKGGVFIYAKVLYNKPYAYCGVDKFGVFKDNCLNNNWANSVNNIQPATKEQRDLLFVKMTEAGYEWNAEKKELRLLITNGGDFFESENYEQKPAWSEEDEDMCYKATAVINRLRAEGKEYVWSTDTLSKLFYWLKSLKQRKGWKPSAEQMRSLHDLNLTGNISYAGQGQTLIELYNDLKKLKGE